MSSFVPAQFNSFTNNFDFETLKNDIPSSFIGRFKNIKNVNDFFDLSRMNKPAGFIDAQQRITYNLSYFAANYLVIACLLFLYCIITNLKFFLFLFAELAVIYFVQKQFGHADEFDFKFFTLQKNVWYTILLVINVPFLFFWSPLSTLFWLSIFSAAIICTHAAFIDKPVEAAYSNAV